ncbi:MAG: GGDEF domain-containing phosphodiesterase [Lachnospiraceae bacterium]|nr:GGDEF domain-containing phosphodiesterase [Lachnospiraceae bacterium]
MKEQRTEENIAKKDVSAIYREDLHKKILEQLVQREYDYICVIDVKKQTVYVDADILGAEWNWTGKELNYYDARDLLTEAFLDNNDSRDYRHSSDIPYIVERLEQQEEYSFMFHFDVPGQRRNKKQWKFSYLNREEGLILTTLKDVTILLEQDHLTGEANRYGFIRRARQVIRDTQLQCQFAIMYFNIKGFKAINELFGTEGGDLALREVVRTIHHSKLYPYAIGRVEADHFVCLVDAANINYENLKEQLHQVLTIQQRSMDVYAVCGIYMIPEHERMESVSNMCDRARIAKDYIEDEYVQPYAVFDASMSSSYMERNDALRDLSHALEKKEFHVYYQPVYDAFSGEIASAEALVRWIREDGTMVSPGIFVPALEDSGRISQMDLFVERSVFSFLEERYHKGQFIVPVSVNMSQMDFFDKDMMASVFVDVSNTDLPVDYTRIEVTETAYSMVASNNRNVLLNMKNIGVKFYLDDFGSGYSSFSTIRDYDFDVVKLDMGFVQKIGTTARANAVIQAIIDMAHAIGSKVVAEGAETKEQVDALRDMKCDYIQGYYFSKPLSEEEFEALLNEQC